MVVGDKYGKVACCFLKKSYQDHRRKNVSSLEGKIEHLGNQITDPDVTHINAYTGSYDNDTKACGWAFFLIAEISTATCDKNYKHLSTAYLLSLQPDSYGGQFSNFFAKQKPTIQSSLTLLILWLSIARTV